MMPGETEYLATYMLYLQIDEGTQSQDLPTKSITAISDKEAIQKARAIEQMLQLTESVSDTLPQRCTMHIVLTSVRNQNNRQLVDIEKNST